MKLPLFCAMYVRFASNSVILCLRGGIHTTLDSFLRCSYRLLLQSVVHHACPSNKGLRPHDWACLQVWSCYCLPHKSTAMCKKACVGSWCWRGYVRCLHGSSSRGCLCSLWPSDGMYAVCWTNQGISGLQKFKEEKDKVVSHMSSPHQADYQGFQNMNLMQRCLIPSESISGRIKMTRFQKLTCFD